jgi:LysM repeat protein
MSRKDTVVIAVLLNAGLLIVLFTMSLKSEKVEDAPSAITVLASHQPEVKETAFPKFTPTITSAPDQVDQVIEKYIMPQVATGGDAGFNFLAELQPIGAPSVETPKERVVQEPHFKEVRVKKGDVLERIAKQHQVTVGDIMKASHLTSTRLKIGQVLKIPAANATVSLSSPNNEEHYYTIQAGDNPWMIAVKHHMKVEELLKLNNLDEQKARRLKAGDKIRIK